jgi:hypothetical protein
VETFCVEVGASEENVRVENPDTGVEDWDVALIEGKGATPVDLLV